MSDNNKQVAVLSENQQSGSDKEIRVMLEAASRKPRDERKSMEGALMELDIAPELASKAFYSIPYKDRSGGQEKTVWVEGPSIKASMALARRWGNCWNGWSIKSQNSERAVVQGLFIDFETGLVTTRDLAVSSERYDKYVKKMVPLREDRLVMAISSAGSKAVRNATLASLPPFLVEAYNNKAKALATHAKTHDGEKELSLKQRIKGLVLDFKRHNVTSDMISDYMSHNLDGVEDRTEKLAKMIGILNALDEGQVKVEDVFVSEKHGEQSSVPTGGTGQVSMEDLMKKNGE